MTNKLDFKEKVFDGIKYTDEYGNDYWSARELQKVLEYKEWRYFNDVIDKAKVACSQSKNDINSHFGVYTKIVYA